MPKQSQSIAHFDADALLQAVQEQDIGLQVQTNDNAGFLRIIYAHMQAKPQLRCYAYSVPQAPNAFFLLRQRAPQGNEAADETLEESAA